jgi:hypothetical protein
MTGGSNPIRRQTDSIRGLRAGLAICLQFQVRRYSTAVNRCADKPGNGP